MTGFCVWEYGRLVAVRFKYIELRVILRLRELAWLRVGWNHSRECLKKMKMMLLQYYYMLLQCCNMRIQQVFITLLCLDHGNSGFTEFHLTEMDFFSHPWGKKGIWHENMVSMKRNRNREINTFDHFIQPELKLFQYRTAYLNQTKPLNTFLPLFLTVCAQRLGCPQCPAVSRQDCEDLWLWAGQRHHAW